MKQLLIGAVLASTALCSMGADRVIYQNGQLAAGVETPGWWNAKSDFEAADPSGAEGKVFKFEAEDKEKQAAAASMGIECLGTEFSTGPLHNATINFKYYVKDGATYTLRVTPPDQDYVITNGTAAVNEWHEASVPVATTFPQVSENWRNDTHGGKGFVFSVILSNGTANSEIYIKDIVYTNIDETWTAPVKEEDPIPAAVNQPTHPAGDVMSLFCTDYTPVTTFGIGGWGQSTEYKEMEIGGKKAAKLTFFNYLGWELAAHQDISEMTHLHFEYWPISGTTIGITPISPGKEKACPQTGLKEKEWNVFDLPLTHWDNVDMADLFQIKFDNGENGSGYLANVYFYKGEEQGGGDDPKPIDPPSGDARIWYGSQTNTQKITPADLGHEIEVTWSADYEVIANADQTLTVKVTDFEITPDNFSLTKKFLIWPGQFILLGDEMTATSTETYTDGQNIIELKFWLEYQGGLLNMQNIEYKYGDTNEPVEKKPTLTLSAEAQDVDSTTAVIVWNLKQTDEFEGVEVKVYCNGDVVENNTIDLSDLTPKTEYNYTLYAEATINEETYKSNEVKINFTTLADGETARTWHAIKSAWIDNAFVPGETAADAHSVPCSVELSATYELDHTITVEARFHGTEVVGFVPKVTCSTSDLKCEYKDMSRVEGQLWRVNTGTVYPEDLRIGWLYIFCAYAGGAKEIGFHDMYVTGAENEAPTFGEATDIEFAVSRDTYLVGQTGVATAVAKDANGNFLLDGDGAPVVSTESAAFTIAGNKVTANNKGVAVLTAKSGEMTKEVEVKCVAPADATNAALGAQHTSSVENATAAFDGNLDSMVVFNCGETQNHYVTVDLGEVKAVHAVQVVWEGASAKAYTVALSVNAPKQDAESVEFLMTERPRRANSYDDATQTFTVTDGEGGPGKTVTNTLHHETLQPLAAQYVSLNTTQAYEPAWGIKLKQLSVLANDDLDDVVTSVAAAFAEGEGEPVYYNLQGERVYNPEGGLYIEVRGGKACKVVLAD